MHKANRKIKEGIVVSDKMAKTVVVLVERKVRHPLFQKVIRFSKKYKAHDEKEQCSVGDTVRIMETRRISAGKNWVVLKVLGKKKQILEDEDKGMPAPVRRVKETEIDTKQV